MSSSFNLADVTLGETPAGDGLKAVPLSSSGFQILWTPVRSYGHPTLKLWHSSLLPIRTRTPNASISSCARHRRLRKLWRNLTLTFWISVSRTAPASLERSFHLKRLLPGMHLA